MIEALGIEAFGVGVGSSLADYIFGNQFGSADAIAQCLQHRHAVAPARRSVAI
jgi:hypothetical protein